MAPSKAKGKASAKKAAPTKKTAAKRATAKPPAPGDTFAKDVEARGLADPAPASETGLMDAYLQGRTVLRNLLMAEDDATLELLRGKGNTTPMLQDLDDNRWISFINAAAYEKEGKQPDLDFVDDNGRVSVRRGIGKGKKVHADELRAWLEASNTGNGQGPATSQAEPPRDDPDEAPAAPAKKTVKQTNLEGKVVTIEGVRQEEYHRTGIEYECEHYKATFTTGQLDKARGAEATKREAMVEKKMTLRKGIEEAPPGIVREDERRQIIAAIMSGA